MSARGGSAAAGADAGAHRAPGDWTQDLRIDASVFVAPGAVIVGDVEIGARAGVWFNTVVRGDTAPVTVGAETNLQDNTVVHVDEGFAALIGMGSIVLTGARIGAGSLVGAGALILEGQQIPPGSTVLGSPAKVVGAVKPEHREAIRRGAAHYVALAASYRSRGFGRPLVAPEAAMAGEARGPLTGLERLALLDALGETPRWVGSRLAAHDDARWRLRPGEGRWSAHEVMCHLRDADRDVFTIRLERLLTDRHPAFARADLSGESRVRGWAGEAPEATLREWTALRAMLVARLAGLTPVEWARMGSHEALGPYGVREMVRGWAEHDLGHRRQMAEALGEYA
ncbi:MAG: DinB family protein [Candidatus Eisenbacteria bacterium]|uniref:DinB family protein n=1 Tax=Eiseniibacteriota bacterium TaxID=2212470 RepID=A0A9D6LAJ7_UNCEI|nr:DinB family protein [Candidatus Eisenbacteria bacterium]